MLKQTPLFEYHQNNGKLINFGGYEMPVWYTNTTDEHLAVRNKSGIFDVSHMGRVRIKGNDASSFLDYLVPTQASGQPSNKSFYTLLLNENAGIIDDLIVTKRNQEDYLLIVNAATTPTDLTHIQRAASGFNVDIEDTTYSTTMIAIQGPQAIQALQPLTSANLNEIRRFRNTEASVGDAQALITRTGYTGEDGFEVILYDSGVHNNHNAMKLWTELARNSKPCGLAARDSLRLEAGLPLYAYDIDENTNPIEADLYWVVSKEKQGYVGYRRLLELVTHEPERIRRGLILTDKIPRRGFQVATSEGETIGTVTSGTFSPILRKGIALAYVKSDYSRDGNQVLVNVRGAYADARIARPPFYDERIYGWKRQNSQTVNN